MLKYISALSMSLLVGCSSEDSSRLVIDVLSDWVPGAEVTSVSVRLDERPPVESVLRIESPLLEGFRAATFDQVSHGVHRLTTALHSAAGTVVGERSTLVEVRADLGFTILIARSCLDVACSEAETTCAAGACVDERCSPANPSACPAAECTTDEDCDAPPASCARALCISGACLAVPIAGECESAFCDPDAGCVPISGLSDASVQMDAGVDAGVDAGADASVDAPPEEDAQVATCEECVEGQCSLARDFCITDSDLATAGPGAGTARGVLCTALVACAIDNGCDPTSCYCGTADSEQCALGEADGPCLDEVVAAAESETIASVLARINDDNYALGRGYDYYECIASSCPTQCIGD